MKNHTPIRILFFIASAYDGLLGLAFLAAAPTLFAITGITPPNHFGYVHFAAALLVVFAWMFLQIARQPLKNKDLITYGILLKICYTGTVLWHTFDGGIPAIWQWFAIADAVFLALFLLAQRTLAKEAVLKN